MTSRKNELVEHYFQKRKNGMELKKIRLELEGTNLSEQEVSDIMATINDMELESLQMNASVGVGVIAKSIAVIFLVGGVALWLWLQSKDFESYYQFLAIIPIIMGIGSYLLFRQNQQKMERRGT